MMRKGKGILLITLIVVACFFAVTTITGYNLVIPVSNGGETLGIKAKPGDEINVFSNFDFTKDNWKAYIVIAREDFAELNPAIGKYTCFKTTDRAVLTAMKKSWEFRITNGDAGTVISDLYLFKNGKLMYKTGIILDVHRQSLQNSEYGNMIPVNSMAMIKTCKQFKRVYWPVVVL